MYIQPKDYIKDWRWRKKIKIIKERDENKCRACNSKKRLNVHHSFYFIESTRPDNYPDDSLITLCNDCHKFLHEYYQDLVTYYPRMPKDYETWKRMCDKIMVIEKIKIEKLLKKLSYD